MGARRAEEEAHRLREEAEKTRARRAVQLQAMLQLFRRGDRVRLNAQGCAEDPDYDWSGDALQPGDLGDVLSCQILDDDVYVFLRGPGGRTDSYSAGDLEKLE